MCSPSIDLSYFCPQKYATTYIDHTHYVLLLFLEVPPTYTHYTLCHFYPRDTHPCCSYPGSMHFFIHPHTFHIHLGNILLKNIHGHYVLFYLSNKAPVILVDTPCYYQCIRRDGWSLKKWEKKERGQKSQCKRKEKKDSQVLILRLGRYVSPRSKCRSRYSPLVITPHNHFHSYHFTSLTCTYDMIV